MSFPDLMAGPPPTHLPEDPAAAELDAGTEPAAVVRAHPESPIAWAALADGRTIEGYAFARTGYHRALDALRRSGWRGQGPVPWSHEPNRGFLRSLAALSRAAGAISETPEQRRCADFLRDSSREGAEALGL